MALSCARAVLYGKADMVPMPRPVAEVCAVAKRDLQPGDTLDWYDASIEWESRESPWLPVAELVLEKPLSDDECERLVLAVDAANEPAIAMYSAAGFWAWEERAIWVKRLG